MDVKKKRLFRPNVTAGQRVLSLGDIRMLAQNEPAEFIRKIQAGVDSGKLGLGSITDLRGLYNALADVPVKVTMENGMGGMRTIMASAFPIMTGTMVIAGINDAYDQVPTIGQYLVTEMDDNKRVTVMAQLNSLDVDQEEVKELQDFPEVGTSEESVHIHSRKNGRKLSISQEAIAENDLPNIVSRVNALGEIAAEHVEELTLLRVTDHTGSGTSPAAPYVYRPAGTGTQLYITTANYPGVRAPSGTRINSNALQDDSDLDAARIRLATMLNERGRRINIPWSRVILLVPYALLGAALKILNSELVPGVENEVNNYGPRGMFSIPPARVISSPRLDDLSTGTWYLGDFARQFVRKWKLRMEYVTLGSDTQAYLDSQVAFQARIAWDVEVGARDYVNVVQNLAATTAPVDGG